MVIKLTLWGSETYLYVLINQIATFRRLESSRPTILRYSSGDYDAISETPEEINRKIFLAM